MRAHHILALLSAAPFMGATAALTTADIPKPKNHLTWGDVNVLHTTDIHGWILGHPKPIFPELNWSGTFGDLYSFVIHMKEEAKAKKSDLLLVDSGDRRIGHGLSDRLLPGTVNGQLITKMYIKMGYDAVTPGNHDLDDASVVKWVMADLSKEWGDKFITSNIRQNTPDTPAVEDGEDSRPFYGTPYRHWESDLTGKRFTAYGFTLSSARVAKDENKKPLLVVKDVNTVIREKWFQKSLEKPTDVFLVVGHVDSDRACDSDGWIYIYDAIRQKHPYKPIMMFGGHSHKRACTRFVTYPEKAKRSMLLQSGRYLDTVGWMSVALDDNSAPRDLKMTRRYLNNNIETYKFHTRKATDKEFETKEGILMSDRIYGIDRAEGLSQIYGFLPGNYYLDRQKWDPSDRESMFNLYLAAAKGVLIDEKPSQPWMFFSNWGIIRGDLYKGIFTLGDLYTVSPNDPSHFRTVTVERHIADKVVSKLQDLKPPKASCSSFAPDVYKNSRRLVRKSECPPKQTWPNQDGAQMPINNTASNDGLTWGLKTCDVCGEDGENTPYGDGDDVEHKPIPQFNFDAGRSVFFWEKSWKDDNSVKANDNVKLIFTNYIGQTVPEALNKIVGSERFDDDSIQNYGRLLQSDLLGAYVRKEHKVIPDDYPMPV